MPRPCFPVLSATSCSSQPPSGARLLLKRKVSLSAPFFASPTAIPPMRRARFSWRGTRACDARRSEEHTSELQSLAYLVCRLLLEKKKKKYNDQSAESTYH